MGQLNVYQGLTDDYKTIVGTGKLKTILASCYPDLDTSKAIVLKEGIQLDGDYEVKADDVLFVRFAVNGVVCAVISVVLAAVSLGASIYSAVKQQEYQKELEKQQKEAKALSEGTQQLPFIKGASNKTALGYSIPYIMGQMYDVPYKITTGYYAVGSDKTKQYWVCNLVNGFNNALIQDISIGTSKIKGATQTITTPEGESISYIADNGIMAFNSDSDFYDGENKLAVKYTGATNLDNADLKIIGTSYGDAIDESGLTSLPSSMTTTQINSYEGLTKQLDNNTYKCDICIASDGLRYYDKNWKSYTCTFDIFYNNGSTTWTKGASLTLSANTAKTVRSVITLSFNAAYCFEKDLKIKIIRTDIVEDSTKTVANPYLLYINNYTYDYALSSSSALVPCYALEDYWRDKTTRMALKVIANDSTEGVLDEINCTVYGQARIFDGSAWTENKYPTRNPASWVLELMTTDIHPHSQYNDNEIALDELGEVYEYCKENEFYCDGIITEDTKKSDIISQILTECNTTMYLANDGLWHFAIEKAQDTPVALLNENSIKNISVSKDFSRKTYAYKTTYTDRESWTVNTIYQTADGLVDSSAVYGLKKIITENSAKYITTFNHAFKYTRRMQAKQLLQPRDIIVQVGHEGDYYPLYSKVLLQAKQLKVGYTSGIIKGVTTKAGLITAISTSDLCDLTDKTKRYGLIIQAQTDNGKEHLYAEIVPNGLKTKELTLAANISFNIVPEYGNVYSFGELNDDGTFTKITNEMMIYGAKENEDGWELTLKDYNSAIFDDGVIPEYKSNLTVKKETGSKLATPTYGDIQSAQIESAALQKNVSAITMYWTVSDSKTITPESGWSTDVPELTSSTPYLWGYTKYVYSDGTYLETAPAVLGAQGAKGDAGTGFILDLSEESFVILETTIEDENAYFQTTANLFHNSLNYSTNSGVSYSATLNGIELPLSLWDKNTIKVPCSYLSTTSDINTLMITCVYNVTIDNVTYTGSLTSQATITKVYSGSSPVLYKMATSDSQIKMDAFGEITPEQLTATKRKVTVNGESDTNDGYITAEYNDDGNEERINYYENQGAEAFDDSAEYYEVVEPFLLAISEDTTTSASVIANGTDSDGTYVAGVFYD